MQFSLFSFLNHWRLNAEVQFHFRM